MRTSLQAIAAVLAAGVFFAAACLAYLCMHFAPTSGLRDWGATRLALLLLLGPTGFKEVLVAGGILILLRQRPALAAVPAGRGRRSRLGESANRHLLGDDGEACLWPHWY
jgi:hypothetical protein